MDQKNEAVQAWQQEVAKATMSFDTLEVALVDCDNESMLYQLTREKDLTSITIKCNQQQTTKLQQSLHEQLFPSTKLEGILLYLFGYVKPATQKEDAVEENPTTKKRGRPKPKVQIVANPHMVVKFCDTPFVWESFAPSDIPAIIALFED